LKESALIKALATMLPQQLALDLAAEFIAMRQDLTSGTLGRSAPGKFVETLVQAMEHLETGGYSKKPNVDQYLRDVQSRPGLDDGLRICAARLARAMYALRSKRSIAHKGTVDPNTYDLEFLLSAAQWILSELVRLAAGTTMQNAGSLVKQIQAPVGGLVEDFGHKKLVLAELSAREELLVLLQREYPNAVKLRDLVTWMDRRSSSTVRSALRAMWKDRAVEKAVDGSYIITSLGLTEARGVLASLA